MVPRASITNHVVPRCIHDWLPQPTMLELTGNTLPAAHTGLDGYSLVPLVTGKTGSRDTKRPNCQSRRVCFRVYSSVCVLLPSLDLLARARLAGIVEEVVAFLV